VAVSRAVAALVRARRVERSVEESDRRRSQLRLTPRGVALYREVVPWALAYEDAVLRGLPARSRQKLDVLLDELQRRARLLRPARILRAHRTPASDQGPGDEAAARNPRE
jgi:DNA-binding MarR family transcriptional regulator